MPPPAPNSEIFKNSQNSAPSVARDGASTAAPSDGIAGWSLIEILG
jgi:hypothetical protein